MAMVEETMDLPSWLRGVWRQRIGMNMGRGDLGGEQDGWRGTSTSRSVGRYSVKEEGRHGEAEMGVIRF